MDWEPTMTAQHTPTAEQMSAQALIDKGVPEQTARTIAYKVHAHDELVAALHTIAESAPIDTASFVCDFDTLQLVARAALAKVAP